MDVFDCLPKPIRDRINNDMIGYSRNFIYILANNYLLKNYDEEKLHTMLDHEAMMVSLKRMK